jgi:hypothetical protein
MSKRVNNAKGRPSKNKCYANMNRKTALRKAKLRAKAVPEVHVSTVPSTPKATPKGFFRRVRDRVFRHQSR